MFPFSDIVKGKGVLGYEKMEIQMDQEKCGFTEGATDPPIFSRWLKKVRELC